MSQMQVDRTELLKAFHLASRRLASQNGLFSDAVAAQLRMNRSDLDALGVVHLHGGVTAGELADVTGLSTGAVTGVIDRLEAGGYVQREPDPADRRRVVVRPAGEGSREVSQRYDPMQRALDALYERYTDDELALALDITDRSLPIVQ